MARHGRGLICLTLTEDRCRRLRLPLMVREAEDRHGTNFTVSIEAAAGRHHRHLRAGSRAHGACGRRARRAPRGPAPARPRVSADGAARRRADARGPHRGRLRPRAARRLRAGRGDRRGAERRRLDGAAPGARALRRGARPRHRHHRRSHPPPAQQGELDRVRGRPHGRDRAPGRFACAGTWTACTAGCTSRWCAARPARRRRSCACTSGTRRATSSASAASTLAGRSARRSTASRANRTASSSCCGRRRSPEDIIGAGAHEQGADAAAGAVLRTYGIGAQILRDLGVSRMRVLSAPRQLLGIAAFGLEVTGYEE